MLSQFILCAPRVSFDNTSLTIEDLFACVLAGLIRLDVVTVPWDPDTLSCAGSGSFFWGSLSVVYIMFH